MRYAVIDGATVTNVIVGPDDFALPGLELVALGPREAAAPGWSYDGQQFTAPGVTVPTDPGGGTPTVPSDPTPAEMLQMIIDLQTQSQRLQDQSDQLTLLIGGGL